MQYLVPLALPLPHSTGEYYLFYAGVNNTLVVLLTPDVT